MQRLIRETPFFLLVTLFASAAMYLPAIHAAITSNHSQARAFFYSGTLGLFVASLIVISLASRPQRDQKLSHYLLSLFAVFILLPVFLAIPFHEALRTTSFLNAYFEMVSSLTTTGATMFSDPARLGDTLHLWRGVVGWLGGFLMWVAAAAILAPLNLGGFEVTANSEPGQGESQLDAFDYLDARRRLTRTTALLFPIYGGLTLALWLLLLFLGDRPVVAVIHAMSTMATSGISPIGGVEHAASGIGGEMVIFLFLLFALSRQTFSPDTLTSGRQSILRDYEFRIAMVLVIGLPVILFLRHWVGALDVVSFEGPQAALYALWGGMFTVLSFLSTTGFESMEWSRTQSWSGLGTPGLLLLGLSLIGGGVATTAGGVKLLRVYALYLHGLRELNRLVYPNSVGLANPQTRRMRKKGAFIAWIFFMLFALSLTAVVLAFAGLGASFEHAMILGLSALSTTGPLITAAAETPIVMAELSAAAKLVFCATMVLGRLETLAIIALFNPELWRR